MTLFPRRTQRTTRSILTTTAASTAALAGLGFGLLAPAPANAAPGLAPATTQPRLAGPAAASDPGAEATSSSDRRIVRHVVRRGETPGGLAVRYHAWTAELIAINGLGHASQLRAGQSIRIPVVVSAARAARTGQATHKTTHQTKHQATQKRGKKARHGHTRAPLRSGWRHADYNRPKVRKIITRRAKIHRVPAKLALAIAWQESGWQQRRVSSSNAIGVMQLLPSTGTWMSQHARRKLWIRDTHDNVTGGLLLIKWLRQNTRRDSTAIAGYYQGLAGVKRHGMYGETRKYVRNVQAIRRNLDRTGRP